MQQLVLPRGLERALHVGQSAPKSLGFPTLASPFAKSVNPQLSRRTPRSVIVWTEFAVRSRLALWWACASFPRASIWVAALPRLERLTEEGCGFRDARELIAAAPALRQLTSTQCARLAENWNAWSRGDARFRTVRIAALPEWLGAAPEWLRLLFPRSTDDGLEPAEIDQWLLRAVGSEWSSALTTIKRVVAGGNLRAEILQQRLGAWSRWKRGRFIEQRSATDLSAREYRLTAEGQMLLHGLPELTAAPPFQFGAFRFYVPGSWVMTPRGPVRMNA